MKKMAIAIVASTVLLGGMLVTAQEKPPAPPRPNLTPLKVQVVLSRFNGDRKVSSMPYTLAVNARPGRDNPVSMRMGVQMPIPTTTKDSSGGKDIVSYQYRNVGTNIDCWASPTEDGRFNLNLSIEQSSPYSDDAQKRAAVIDQPIFRSFNSSFFVVLKDGETSQYATATDPVSGEVLKIDVTLNVVK